MKIIENIDGLFEVPEVAAAVIVVEHTDGKRMRTANPTTTQATLSRQGLLSGSKIPLSVKLWNPLRFRWSATMLKPTGWQPNKKLVKQKPRAVEAQRLEAEALS